MLPKSKHQVYVGFDEGTQAVKYYNAETCKILTSWKFHHIDPPVHPTPPEPIELTPNMAHEGESAGDTPPVGVTGSDDTTCNLEPKWKHKQNEVEGDVDINEPQKTHGIHTDYKLLHDPFPEKEEEETFLTMEEVYAIIAGDELTSLKDAKNSPEWSEWEWAMQEQLDLLKEMGTWETVPKPPDAVPIAKKWVFVKKQNKEGNVVRYKARLVAKGCAQHPGQDYMETFLPVVRMDTLHAILALVLMKELKMQQMDVKGAYLNGTLQETIYMWQPEGCEDGTGRVCRLIKPLYGLKQVGHKQNNKLDDKLKVHGYDHLFSDPCAYIQWDAGNFGIMAVWVDDSLLFASSDDQIEHIKDTLCSEWEVTDLGESTKIVGIEVTRTDDSISISQYWECSP
jgi:Reverse transcriptase (RNA-dependent DNA polymerase)